MKTPARLAAFILTMVSFSGCLNPSVRPMPMAREASNHADAEDAVRRKLDATLVNADYGDKHFEVVVSDLAASSGVTILPHWSAMEAAAIERDAEVNMHLGKVRLSDALRHVLDQVGGGEVSLDMEVNDGALVISTQEDLSRRTTTRLYPVGDLLSRVHPSRTWGEPLAAGSVYPPDAPDVQEMTGPGGATLRGLDAAARMIMSKIDPESWRAWGGNVGSLAACGDVLVVTQTLNAHREIAGLLDGLRAAHGLPAAGISSEATLRGQRVLGLADDRINEQEALRRKLRETRTRFVSDERSLSEVFAELSRKSGVNIIVPWSSLEIVAIDREKSVTLQLNDVSVADALRRVLDDIGGTDVWLDSEIRNGAVVVSTQEDLARRTTLRLYPVGDLARGGRIVTRYGSLSGVCKGSFDGPTSLPPEMAADLARFDGVHGLAMLIVPIVDPESWRDLGGNTGSIGAYGETLVIRATANVHDQIVELLTGLRAAYGIRSD